MDSGTRAGSKLVCIFLLALLRPPAICFAQEQAIQWTPVAPGVWRGVTGTPDAVTPLSIAAIHPQTEALKKLSQPVFPEMLSGSVSQQTDGKTFLRFPLKQDEQLFGLGLNFKTVQQRGTVKYLHADHYDGSDNGRTHAPVPFYVSSDGYGVLINSARYITVYAGTAVRVGSKNPPPEMNRNSQPGWNAQPYSDAVEILVPAAGAEVYVFSGNSTMEVVQRYNLYCGGGALPPKWGLGFTLRTKSLFSDREVAGEVNEFETRGYPLSFIGLEPGWQSRSYPNTFVWDSTRFPHPASFVQQLLAKNIRVNLWINPYVSTASPLFKDIQSYSGSHKVWVGYVPDITIGKVRDAYKSLFAAQHLNAGVSGYKIDEVDGYDNWLWPDVATFPSGVTAEQMRQVYGLGFQKMTYDWFREMNSRTYGLVRASNAGSPAMPYVIYDDYYDHRDFITALCNSSFIGVLWTPEARSSRTSEEWLRRMQSVCFSPMAMLNAWADGTQPWTFTDVADEVKAVMQLRMQLLPYLYTTFAQYHFEGKPPVRAMDLLQGFHNNAKKAGAELNSTDNPYALGTIADVKDQFMVGDNLLVAPMFAGDTTRKVLLPPGKWFDFYSGQPAGENEVINITPHDRHIPLFVRDGGIIPMIPVALHSPGKEDILPLTARYYGTRPSKFSLYDDDGQTFNYEKGNLTWTPLEVKTDRSGKPMGNNMPGQLKGTHYKDLHWEYMTK